MITNLQTFEINSFYCQQNNMSTSDVSCNLDVPQDYLNEITHICLFSARIPKTFTQLDNTDVLTLTEAGLSATYTYPAASYDNKTNMMMHLQLVLNNISPKGFTYTVADNTKYIDDMSINITCSDTSINKNISLNGKYLTRIYGLSESNNFTSSLLGTPINLSPIGTVYVHSNVACGFNSSGLLSNDILASIDVSRCGVEQQFDMYTTMKPFAGVKNMRFYLTDFDNYPLNLYSNDWKISIGTFTYRESFFDKISSFVDFATVKLTDLYSVSTHIAKTVTKIGGAFLHFLKK